MAKIDAFFNLMFEQKASDLHMSSGNPPILRINGELMRVDYPPLESDALKAMLYEISPEYKVKQFEETGDVDFGYEIPNISRFRVNFFNQKNGVAAVFRQIPTRVLSFEDFEKFDAPLPAVLKKFCMLNRGLIVVTGPTGSGKSTTLAAILNEINKAKPVHIVTLEDPVEYIHPHLKATFNQRELGIDFDTYPNGLRAALRQAPKVILVGEMRDQETVKIALSAAETGHLVLSTLHTINAGETVNRILGMFEPEEQEQIRIRLADSLRWIVSQRLAPKIGGARHALLEIMGRNLRTEETIRLGESEGKTFYEIIEASYTFGWRTFDHACIEAFEKGVITEETALLHCSKRGVVARSLDHLKKQRGENTSTISSLRMKTPPLPSGGSASTLKLK